MKKLAFLAVLAAIALTASWAEAKDGPGRTAPAACGDANCCAHCGCRRACKQVTCEVVCEIKKEKKTQWVVECKPVCPLLPGKHCGGCGDPCCNSCKSDCGSCGGKGCGKCTPPRCGHPRPVKKLIKKEIEVEKPVYKCVAKFLCDSCEEETKEAKPAPAAPAEPITAPKAPVAPKPAPIPPPKAPIPPRPGQSAAN